jgi:methyl-accepting chemotaxis protein
MDNNSGLSLSRKDISGKLKMSFERKMGISVIIATLISLFLGAPVTAVLKQYIIETGVLNVFGDFVVNLINTYLAILVNLIIVVSIVVFTTRRYIVKPIMDVVENIKDLSEGSGNLTQRLKAKYSDESQLLAFYLNKFIDDIHQIVKLVMESAKQVSERSQELSLNSTEAGKASEEIARGIQEIAEGSNYQVENINRLKQEIDALSKNIDTLIKGTGEAERSSSFYGSFPSCGPCP